jgi:anthranilate synthase component I
MKYEKFIKLSEEFNLIPVYEILTADLLTPVLAYLKIRDTAKHSFLLESVEGSATMARYSFIGINPIKIISNKGLTVSVIKNRNETKIEKNIFEFIRETLAPFKQAKVEELPDFSGGMVGFIGYENIGLIENVISFKNDNFDNPDSILGLYHTILAFDHYKHQIILITNIFLDGETSPEEKYKIGKEILNELKSALKKPLEYSSDFKADEISLNNFPDENFYKDVNSAKENIKDGDIFQIVLSKRFSTTYTGDLFNVYRALRIINPSPYMYFLEFGNEFNIIGTSPEDLVKVKNRRAHVLPIAGTRRRGKNINEDKLLENELLNDPKELAEHTMLVDLGRNDLGKVCDYGSVQVTEQKRIQRYSHVMHIVSKVEGNLREDKDAIDALTACFPAGTVTGAPKIRAIQLIDNYEKERRNIYAGSVGYFDFSGNLDMCIAIRTLFAKDNIIFWQSGAGIVADSIPELEGKEIINKSAAMIKALKFARSLDENLSN